MDKLKAYWICGREIHSYTATIYRKDFIVDKKCNKALLHITATNRFAFWINGEIILYGPKRTHAGYKEYDTLDITKYLKVGRNSFAAAVVYSPSCALIKKDGLIAQADIDADGEIQTVITDSSWVFAPAEWYGTGNLIISSGTELQEHFDSNKYLPNWQTEEYTEIPQDAEAFYTPTYWHKKTDCGRYKPVSVLGPYYTAPWIDLLPRTTAMSQNIDFTPSCVWQGKDSCEKYKVEDNLAILFNDEAKSGEAVNIEKESYNNNDYNIFVFDFLKTRTVRPGIVINKLSGDARIEFYYSIQLNDAPIADRGFGGKQEGFCDTFIPNAENMKWSALTAKGFRFMTVRIAGNCEIDFSPDCQLIEYPFGENKKPEIKNDILNKAWDIAAETIRSTTTDYYVDTCWRENALWTYDASVTSKAAFDTFGETAMWRNSMLGVARSVDQFGIPKALAIPGSPMVLMDQNLVWIIYCLEYYKSTCDIEFLKEVYTPISNMLNYCEKCVTSEDLFIPPKGTWHYIDWVKVDKTPYSLPVNALYILANDTAADIAKLLNDTDKAEIFKTRADKIRNACIRFFDENQGAFLCSIKPNIEIGEYNRFSFRRDDGSGAFQFNVYANCLAIKAAIGTEEMRKSTADFIALNLAPENWNWSDIGCGAFDLLLAPLLDYGKYNEIVAYLEMRLKTAINNKIPTFGETSTSNIYNSAHGWQSCINSLIKRLTEYSS